MISTMTLFLCLIVGVIILVVVGGAIAFAFTQAD